MERIAIFPGSFDPFTIGHQSLVHRGLELFDRIVVGIGVNSKKQYLFSEQERTNMILQSCSAYKNRVSVIKYDGLTVDYCRLNNINFILRGIRNSKDFLMEFEIAGMNNALNSNIETVILASYPEHCAINSTIVREIYKNGGNVSAFLPVGMKLPEKN